MNRTRHKHPTDRPLRRVIWSALRAYPKTARGIMVATFPLVLSIGILRWLTDDYTGDQYAVLIILIAAFSTLVAARIAVAGWNWRETRLLALYNGLMMRYLSALGLLAVAIISAIPFIGGFFLGGLVLVSGWSRWWMIPALAIVCLGYVVVVRTSLALYALADDMELSVLQAYRISNRITKQNFWAYAWRLASLGGAVMVLALFFGIAGAAIAGYIQDASTQLVIDLLGSWLITPLLIFVLARLYQALVEAYE